MTPSSAIVLFFVSLDLSAVFDTIDQAVLYYCSFGITDTVYSWLQS